MTFLGLRLGRESEVVADVCLWRGVGVLLALKNAANDVDGFGAWGDEGATEDLIVRLVAGSG